MQDKPLLRHFTHITIPREIWIHEVISMQAKALWAELRSLHCPEHGGCFASEEYLCQFLQLKRSRFYEILKELKDAGLLEIVNFDGRQTVRRAIVPSVEYGRGQQQSGKPDSSSPENRTPQVRKTGLAPYIENKEENKDKDIARTTSLPSKKTIEISFSFEERQFKNITSQDLEGWKEIYPSIDINHQIKEMIEWNLSNQYKAKRKTNLRRFITTWLKQASEKAINRQAYQQRNQQNKNEQILARHTGLQQDHSPRPAHKTWDFSELEPFSPI